MRRVILVNPKMCSPRSVRLPLSLLALGAVLEDRYEYRIVDGNVDPDAVGTILRLTSEAEVRRVIRRRTAVRVFRRATRTGDVREVRAYRRGDPYA